MAKYFCDKCVAVTTTKRESPICANCGTALRVLKEGEDPFAKLYQQNITEQKQNSAQEQGLRNAEKQHRYYPDYKYLYFRSFWRKTTKRLLFARERR